ncbi:acylneuraminate cytidylyltransferase family protein [Neptuniibacter sp. QD72_48]|uniref:acylneuraminate cytidylyltransferase family protein n=1 Tax=unclassified Neptuniibacter TaxID=2630693 RepID=UPI0039F471A4
MIIAIIPARGGSKGIPRKNIKPIAGKPLIAWTIEHALNSKRIDKVIVSTDCPDIAKIASDCGAYVPFLRPSQIANDTATTESAVINCLDWLRDNDDIVPSIVVLLQCTSPVRLDGSIDNALSHFFSGSYDSLLSTTEFWHFLWENEKRPTARYDFLNRPRRQDIPQKQLTYRENGSIYITKETIYRDTNNRLGGEIGMYVMSEEESYEIDTPTDWVINEAILKLQAGKKS